ncbi:MAG TPA: DUF937 domain-containing protein [Gemmatimonadaceae bacterium]|nr:DUF937 domain-containing protein [Gemmatimonadaceae bacterium]
MAGIFDIVQQQLSGGAVQQVAQRAGIDPAIAQQAVTAAVPMILGGMAQHASQPGNAEVIHAEADKYAGNAGSLGNLPNVFTGQGESGGLLGKLVGHRHDAIQNGVADAAGIDKAQAAKVIGVLAPVVLGAIAIKKHQDGLAPTEVSGELQQAHQDAKTQVQQQSPRMGGILGSVMGDIMNREGPRA